MLRFKEEYDRRRYRDMMMLQNISPNNVDEKNTFSTDDDAGTAATEKNYPTNMNHAFKAAMTSCKALKRWSRPGNDEAKSAASSSDVLTHKPVPIQEIENKNNMICLCVWKMI
jgi:hypothetical protein